MSTAVRTNQKPARVSQLSLRKRIAFRLLLILFIIIFIELSSFIGFWIVEGHSFSWARAETPRDFIAQEDDLEQASTHTPPEILHPYVGYVANPASSKYISTFGYGQLIDPIQHRADDKVIIGMMGGSVAYRLADRAKQTLVEHLQDSPRFADKQIVLLNLAIGGYKQPQQLMTLNYILALGGEFDIVVNLDGFNEVALHNEGNATKNVFPIYPRSWYPKTSQLPDPALRQLVCEKAILESQRASLSKWFSGSYLRYSITCNLIWRLRDRSMRQENAGLADRIRDYRVRLTEPYVVTGPRIEFKDDQELYEHLVGIWKRCSMQMDSICRGAGIRYFHFLQPNQYVAGSKPMGEEERRIAYQEDHPYRPGAQSGYPLLIEQGKRLSEMGIRFTDLTQLFATEHDMAYSDACCHFTTLGRETIAERIAQEILNDTPEKN
ncbi:MAG: hypothetical protein JXQ75_15990 [Phycisphaerae bacterium]|nr:hypothetical protein [Phycisphaerae bacterium]